jgi:excisionase family DNA binding protein
MEHLEPLHPHSRPAPRPAAGPLLKPTEVARRLGVSRTWLYAPAKDGRIPSVRIGGPDGPLPFVPEDLEAWLDEARAAWRPGDTSAATLRRMSEAA